MYGVLHCCTHVGVSTSENLMGPFYVYLYQPTVPYSETSFDMALHMGQAECVEKNQTIETMQ